MLQQISVTILAVLLGGILLLSCSRVQPQASRAFTYDPQVQAKVYFPHQVGNSWTYDVEEFTPNSDEPMRSALITRVESEDGESFTLSTGDQQVRHCVAADGILRLPSNNYLIHQPIEPGQSWEILNNGISGTASILSVDEKAITNAGVFSDCLLIEERYPEAAMTIRYTFAPNIGLVRVENFAELEGESFMLLRLALRIYRVQRPDKR